MPLLPDPPVELAPSHWPGLALMAGTVYLEAEGEPDEGKLAVAWVIRNRLDHHPRFQHDSEAELLPAVILAPQQFSCWSDGLSGVRRARLTAPGRAWIDCWRAACAAFWRLQDDPSGSADHYLNETLARATRAGGDLPRWFREDRVTARIGAHTFLRLA